jgi:hypothetical protein
MTNFASRGAEPKGHFHRLLVGQPQRVGDRTVQAVAQLSGWRRGRRGKSGEGGLAFFRVSPVALFLSEEGNERVAIPLAGAQTCQRRRLVVLFFLAVGLIGLLIPIAVQARMRKGG